MWAIAAPMLCPPMYRGRSGNSAAKRLTSAVMFGASALLLYELKKPAVGAASGWSDR